MKLVEIPFLSPIGFRPIRWHFARNAKDGTGKEVIYLHCWYPESRVYTVSKWSTSKFQGVTTRQIKLPPVTLTYFMLRYD